MKRRPGARERAAADEMGTTGLRSVDEVVTALRALTADGHPLPAIDPPDPAAECYGTRLADAYKVAYSTHPVMVAAKAWQRIEYRQSATFGVLGTAAHVPVRAAIRWQRENPDPAHPVPPPPPGRRLDTRPSVSQSIADRDAAPF